MSRAMSVITVPVKLPLVSPRMRRLLYSPRAAGTDDMSRMHTLTAATHQHTHDAVKRRSYA